MRCCPRPTARSVRRLSRPSCTFVTVVQQGKPNQKNKAKTSIKASGKEEDQARRGVSWWVGWVDSEHSKSGSSLSNLDRLGSVRSRPVPRTPRVSTAPQGPEYAHEPKGQRDEAQTQAAALIRLGYVITSHLFSQPYLQTQSKNVGRAQG